MPAETVKRSVKLETTACVVEKGPENCWCPMKKLAMTIIDGNGSILGSVKVTKVLRNRFSRCDSLYE